MNIRPPKWRDSRIWIGKIEKFAEAQYIADAVFHYIGRAPFHFKEADFQFPPLHIDGKPLLSAREDFQTYVKLIAKSDADRQRRQEFRTLVTDVVRETVKNREAHRWITQLQLRLSRSESTVPPSDLSTL